MEIIRCTGSKSKISYKPLPQDDPKQRRPDISRARTWLKWEPKVSLAEGLEKTIAYFRNREFSWRDAPHLLVFHPNMAQNAIFMFDPWVHSE